MPKCIQGLHVVYGEEGLNSLSRLDHPLRLEGDVVVWRKFYLNNLSSV